MAERIRTPCSETLDSKREFLEVHNVNNWIRDVLSQLVANRPEDPIGFLAQFFDNMGEKTSRISQAFELVNISHHSRPVFDRNIAAAYEVLSKQKNLKHPTGLIGSLYKTLLDALCSSIPDGLQERLYKKISPKDFEFIPLDVFHFGVLSCLVLLEFLQLTEALFHALDTNRENLVDKYLCEAVIKELEDILQISSVCDSQSYIRVGKKLQPDGLALALVDAEIISNSKQRARMHCEEFSSLTAELFIAKIKPLR